MTEHTCAWCGSRHRRGGIFHCGMMFCSPCYEEVGCENVVAASEEVDNRLVEVRNRFFVEEIQKIRSAKEASL